MIYWIKNKLIAKDIRVSLIFAYLKKEGNMELLVNTPKTKRGEATLEKICQVAQELFYEKGYHNTSIVDITNNAEIGLGTFYIYFKDKYSIYKYLLLRYSHKIRKAIATATEGIDDRLEMERVGLKTFLYYIRENKHAYNIIWESLYIDKQLFVDYYDSFAERYTLGMKAAQKQGEVLDIDPTTLSYMLMGISNFIGLKYVMFDEDDNNIDKVVDDVISIIQRGMFVPKDNE